MSKHDSAPAKQARSTRCAGPRRKAKRPRRVLVTGAAGFIGAHVVDAALAQGWRVTAVDTRWNPRVMERPGVVGVQADILAKDGLTPWLNGVAGICHVAGFIPPCMENPAFAKQCLRVNALGTLKLLEALARNKHPPRLVYFSAGAAYEFANTPVAETAPLYPANRASYYIASKMLGELYVEHFRRAGALHAISLRIGACYGPGMPATGVIPAFLRAARAGKDLVIKAGARATYDYVYVADVAHVAVQALATGADGIYNIGSGRTWNAMQLAQTVVEIFPEQQPRIISAPFIREQLQGFSALDSRKAHGTWGFTPRSLTAGLRDLWLSQEISECV